MYDSYPPGGRAQEPPRTRPPRSVLNAVKLMYAGAAVEAVSVIIALVFRSTLKSSIFAQHPNYTVTQLHTAEGARTIPLVIGGLIAIGLWLWMAWANGKGLSWARVLSAIFFGISTLDALIVLFLVRDGIVTGIIGAVIWAIGLVAIVLLFSRDSGPFYDHKPA